MLSSSNGTNLQQFTTSTKRFSCLIWSQSYRGNTKTFADDVKSLCKVALSAQYIAASSASDARTFGQTCKGSMHLSIRNTYKKRGFRGLWRGRYDHVRGHAIEEKGESCDQITRSKTATPSKGRRGRRGLVGTVQMPLMMALAMSCVVVGVIAECGEGEWSDEGNPCLALRWRRRRWYQPPASSALAVCSPRARIPIGPYF